MKVAWRGVTWKNSKRRPSRRDGMKRFRVRLSSVGLCLSLLFADECRN
jgi:hypothetical protein